MLIMYCYGLCLDVPPKPHAVISEAFSDRTGSIVCDARIDSWYNARLKDTKNKSVSVTHPKQNKRKQKELWLSLVALLPSACHQQSHPALEPAYGGLKPQQTMS